MRSRVLEIVVFLIDLMQGSQGRMANTEELAMALELRGYSEDEISTAYTWLLDRFEQLPEQYYAEFPPHTSARRVLTPSERTQLSAEAHGFLLKLSNLSLIDNEQFEAILERVALFGPRSIELDQMKLIASTVVFEDIDDIDGFSVEDGFEPNSLRVN